MVQQPSAHEQCATPPKKGPGYHSHSRMGRSPVLLIPMSAPPPLGASQHSFSAPAQASWTRITRTPRWSLSSGPKKNWVNNPPTESEPKRIGPIVPPCLKKNKERKKETHAEKNIRSQILPTFRKIFGLRTSSRARKNRLRETRSRSSYTRRAARPFRCSKGRQEPIRYPFAAVALGERILGRVEAVGRP